MGRVILVTGGCRSGKSRYAQGLAEGMPGRRLYVATCPVADDEMRQRVRKHREARAAAHWDTLEAPVDLARAIDPAAGGPQGHRDPGGRPRGRGRRREQVPAGSHAADGPQFRGRRCGDQRPRAAVRRAVVVVDMGVAGDLGGLAAAGKIVSKRIAAGALIAHALCPTATEYVIAAHRSAEVGHTLMQEHLGKKPLLDLALRLGEGTGAALAMNLVEAAVRVLTEVATFDEASVSKADK